MMMTIIISFVVAYLVATVYMNVHVHATSVNTVNERDYNAEIEQAADRIIAILEDYPNTKMIYWGED